MWLRRCELPLPRLKTHNAWSALQELDKHDALHRDWWAAIGLVVDHELYEEQKREDIDRAK